MRISDWSSDVCSSDLEGADHLAGGTLTQADQRLVHQHLAVGEANRHEARVLAEFSRRDHPNAAPGSDDLAHRLATLGLDGGHQGEALGTRRRLDALARLRAALAQHQHLRSEEHTSELQSLMRISYAVFCLKKKKKSK